MAADPADADRACVMAHDVGADRDLGASGGALAAAPDLVVVADVAPAIALASDLRDLVPEGPASHPLGSCGRAVHDDRAHRVSCRALPDQARAAHRRRHSRRRRCRRASRRRRASGAHGQHGIPPEALMRSLGRVPRWTDGQGADGWASLVGEIIATLPQARLRQFIVPEQNNEIPTGQDLEL